MKAQDESFEQQVAGFVVEGSDTLVRLHRQVMPLLLLGTAGMLVSIVVLVDVVRPLVARLMAWSEVMQVSGGSAWLIMGGSVLLAVVVLGLFVSLLRRVRSLAIARRS